MGATLWSIFWRQAVEILPAYDGLRARRRDATASESRRTGIFSSAACLRTIAMANNLQKQGRRNAAHFRRVSFGAAGIAISVHVGVGVNQRCRFLFIVFYPKRFQQSRQPRMQIRDRELSLSDNDADRTRDREYGRMTCICLAGR